MYSEQDNNKEAARMETFRLPGTGDIPHPLSHNENVAPKRIPYVNSGYRESSNQRDCDFQPIISSRSANERRCHGQRVSDDLHIRKNEMELRGSYCHHSGAPLVNTAHGATGWSTEANPLGFTESEWNNPLHCTQPQINTVLESTKEYVRKECQDNNAWGSGSANAVSLERILRAQGPSCQLYMAMEDLTTKLSSLKSKEEHFAKSLDKLSQFLVRPIAQYSEHIARSPCLSGSMEQSHSTGTSNDDCPCRVSGGNLEARMQAFECRLSGVESTCKLSKLHPRSVVSTATQTVATTRRPVVRPARSKGFSVLDKSSKNRSMQQCRRRLRTIGATSTDTLRCTTQHARATDAVRPPFVVGTSAGPTYAAGARAQEQRAHAMHTAHRHALLGI
eukprot:m.352876 g.352876  ORF g.352876 m.352876 type:complete len:391 (-) comp20714_c0_seq1:1940-3112(-)